MRTIALLLLTAALGFVLDYGGASPGPIEVGEVIARHYSPATTSVQAAVTVDANGNAMPTTIVLPEPEKFTLIVGTASGVRSLRVSASDWAAHPEKSRISVYPMRGLLTGIIYLWKNT